MQPNFSQNAVFQSPIKHIAVVIPAHNEADSIAECLTAIVQASEVLHDYLLNNSLPNIQISILPVLDSCRDNTQAVVEAFAKTQQNLHYLTCDFRCVGKVRALGVAHAIAQGADWLACTDADSQVREDWLVTQVMHLQEEQSKNIPCDMICGVVSVTDWGSLSQASQEKYLAHYQDCMNHRHIHGANLSFLATAYQKVGGFAKMPSHEDVDLVKKFEAQAFNIVWSNRVRVMTSSRLEARASEGFAHFLANLSV